MKVVSKSIFLKLVGLALAVLLMISPALVVTADTAVTGSTLALSHLGESLSPAFVEEFYKVAPAYRPQETVDLTIPSQLAITRPTKAIETESASYFITGTSDPTQNLYFGEELLSRTGTKGTFGVKVDLEPGNNLFTFAQGLDRQEVTIYRGSAGEGAIDPLTTIPDYSMVPSATSAYRVGDILILSCIAPSGSQVTATVDGKTVRLTQVAPTEEEVPATYSASYTLPPSYPNEETTLVGSIGYTLTYKGTTTEYQSKGQLYIAGKDAMIMGRVNSYTGFVYPVVAAEGAPVDESTFRELLKEGATDYIVGQYGGYYHLASGGSIPRRMMDILTGSVSIDNQLSAVEYSRKPATGEYFVFQGTTTPAYHGEVTETEFVFTLYNTNLESALEIPPSVLFSGGIIAQVEDSVVVTLPFKKPTDNFYWGYNVVYGENGQLFLELQHKPRLVKSAKPLENVKIVLDPGHGGEDPGAFGVAGASGPIEANLNLAHTFAAQRYLEALGANVVLTRTTDNTVSLDERLRIFADEKADLFISLHHNSIDIHLDANLPSGTEAYYYNALSKPLAESQVAEITKNTERDDRTAIESYYRVTILPYAPSALVELGFISNPIEYEKACDPTEIDKVGRSVATGVLELLK